MVDYHLWRDQQEETSFEAHYGLGVEACISRCTTVLSLVIATLKELLGNNMFCRTPFSLTLLLAKYTINILKETCY